MRRLLFVCVVAACGNDPKVKQDAGVVFEDAGAPDASCFDNPTTHYEIINACTTAQQIYKDSDPPLLNSDGTFPDLP